MDEKLCEGPCSQVIIDKDPPCPLECGTKTCKSYADHPKPDLRDHVFVWMYGGPSTGKSTQVSRICGNYGFTSVNVGDLLIADINKKPTRAPCLQNCMARGELIPNDIVLELLEREILSKAPATNGFVIDGFPREERQGRLFETRIAPCDLFLVLDLDRETMTKRHVARAKVTQKRWPTDKRNDNCPFGIYQVHLFYEHNKNILEQYPHKVIRIDAIPPIEEVTRCISPFVEKAVAKKKKAGDERRAKEEYYKSLGEILPPEPRTEVKQAAAGKN